MGKSNTYISFSFLFFPLFFFPCFWSNYSHLVFPKLIGLRVQLYIQMIFVLVHRAMDFTLALLQKLATDPEQSMEEAVEESYNITLKPWHGWISSAAFKVVI
jgi:hypothetical protein